ncbi:MAG: tetratricopeptide repeat protein, partial [Archangium sp.]|nr:tetratricopeptide repeat protein [Archangium sp.]
MRIAILSFVLAAPLAHAALEDEIHQKRLDQLGIAKGITNAGPDVYFRVAELWFDEARFFLLKEDKAARETATKNAVATCRELMDRFPRYERMDEVLASMGNALLDLDDDARAVVAFKRLVEKYPTSSRASEAWFHLGENYFAKSNGRSDWLKRARAAYVEAQKASAEPLRSDAKFKEAFCAFNLQDFTAALLGFEDVARSGQPRAKEARSAYVLVFVRSGGQPAVARAALTRITNTVDERRALEQQLASRYHEDGFDRAAAVVWQALITERPEAPEAFAYQTSIIDAVMRMGNKELTTQQVRKLVQLSSSLPASVDRSGAEELLAKLATTWHTECRKTKEEGCLRFPSAVYDSYLTIFPNTARAYELHFFFAELLFETNEFARAANEYRAVVDRDAACKTTGACSVGKFFEKAALGEIHSREALALRD